MLRYGVTDLRSFFETIQCFLKQFKIKAVIKTMKFSELWLREWVNPAIDSDALANQTRWLAEVDALSRSRKLQWRCGWGRVERPASGTLTNCVTKANVGGERPVGYRSAARQTVVRG